MDFNGYWIPVVEEHSIIRDTVGYKVIEDIDLVDMPEFLNFLQIVYNYCIIKDKLDEINNGV